MPTQDFWNGLARAGTAAGTPEDETAFTQTNGGATKSSTEDPSMPAVMRLESRLTPETPAPQQRPSPKPKPGPSIGKGRLLVVDDSRTQSEALQALLTQAGYVVDAAEDSLAA